MHALDPEIALQLVTELPADVFAEVARTFEADLTRLAGEMRQAAQTADADGYRRSAHALAGAAGSIGARTVEDLARQAMRPANPASMVQGVGDVEAALQAALRELQDLIEATRRR